MADENITPVYVPMLVHAYVNYDRRKAPDAADQAVLAPITTPNFQALSLHNDGLKHDIFSDLPQTPYLSTCDPARVAPSRRGIYVHWVIPKHYRTAVTGSATAALADQAAKAGYKNAGENDQPTYHQVPTRWFITRRIKSGYDPIGFQKYKTDGSGNAENQTVTISDSRFQDNGDRLSNNVLTNVFVIDGVGSDPISAREPAHFP